jgi:hypothetical protein
MLKIFVVVSGILLVVGTITLVALVVTRSANRADNPPFSEPLRIPGQISSIAGVGERLAMLVESNGEQLVILIDAETGEEVARIEIETAP